MVGGPRQNNTGHRRVHKSSASYRTRLQNAGSSAHRANVRSLTPARCQAEHRVHSPYARCTKYAEVTDDRDRGCELDARWRSARLKRATKPARFTLWRQNLSHTIPGSGCHPEMG